MVGLFYTDKKKQTSPTPLLHYYKSIPSQIHNSQIHPQIITTKDIIMENKEEDVRVGANKFPERQPIGTAAQTQDKDYKEPPPAPLFEPGEITSWSFYRAGIAEFIATFLFLYISILTVMGVQNSPSKCASVGIQGIAWAFGGMIFALVYCTAGISGGHINPAVTLGLFLARKLSLTRAVFYMVMQCLGAICGAGVVKGFHKTLYMTKGGGANVVNHGYTKGDGLGAEILGTFVLVYTVFSATDAKRSARDSHVPILAPLPIGFAVFLVHLATIPITGTGINPARSLGAAIIYNKDAAWNDHKTKYKHTNKLRKTEFLFRPKPKPQLKKSGMDVIKSQQISSRPIDKVVVHPLVLLSIVDHYNRVARDTRKRVVGVLLGSSFKGTVDVTNSYAAKEHVVGWYSTGPKLKENDLNIHGLFSDYVSTPVLVIIDVQPKELGIPTKAYYAVEEVKENATQKSQNVFVHVPSEIAAHEVEEIGVEHLLRDVKDTTISTLATEVTGKLAALKGLDARLKEIRSYLDLVIEEKLPLNHEILYHLQDVFNLLPNLNVSELVKSFAVKTNDMMLVIYLSSLIRSVIALHNLINNKMLNKEHEKAEDSKPVAVPTAAGS
ncbi:hypothetical protein SASPL_101536 [Salvia splendens]|uniref:JAB1/MPN/MOV34 metalloenzyme domain-containing protein n=1 Tax=Salvia splendens TaxID=180675 RepID=A0A8X9ADX3_SALSN|nr:hypothetical protein SASPL_101536 [Salvia splendens]